MDEHSLDCLDFAQVRELLAEHALTGLGRSLADNVRPVTRAPLVRRWLDQVREMERLVELRGMPPFGGITDVRDLLPRCAPPLKIGVEEVARLGDTLYGTHAVARHLRDLPEDFPELLHLAGRVGDFVTVADRIRRVIDERGRVRDDASPKLARVRQEIEQATREIRHSVDRMVADASTRKMLQFPNHTFHGDRLVLPVKAEYRGRVEGIMHRTSDTGATIYVEPAAVVQLNNRITNLRMEEQEEINRLLWELVHEVHLNSKEIRQTLDTLAVIDLIVAKLRFAKAYQLHCPTIIEENRLHVRGARHLLLVDLFRRKAEAGETPGEVVPIDYRLGSDFNLLIITGPNTGGKTVALKTVGLNCLMLQSGIPVPVAEGSEMGVFTHVLIDVGDEQSMQQSLSTFSAHMTRILDMLRRAGPRTLLLIDELGAGTDPDEGAALGRALLDEILRLHCLCIATTHLGALKGFALTRHGAENACVDFDIQTLRPTFHLRIGEPGQSNAIEVAQRLGMSRRLISAARRNVTRKARALNTALEGARVVKRRAEDARRAAEEAQLEAGRAQSAASAAQQSLEQQQADFRAWVQRVVHLQAGDRVRVRNFDRDGKIVRLRLDQQRAEVDVGAFAVEVPLGDVLPPEVPAPPERAPRPAAAAPAPPPRPRPAAPRPQPAQEAQPVLRPAYDPPHLTRQQAERLKPLDTVYIKRFQREGRVVRLRIDKEVATVAVGQLELEVPFDGLALPPGQAARPRPAKRGARQPKGSPAPRSGGDGASRASQAPTAAPPESAAPQEAPPTAASPSEAHGMNAETPPPDAPANESDASPGS